MTTAPWHLDPDLAGRYAGGALGTVLSASVEQHLVACAPCRALLVPHVDTARLDRVWSDVLERVEQPPVTLLERALRSLGMTDASARVVATTPSLRGAWVAGTTLVLGLALVAAYLSPHGVAVYLALAPLLPMAGVAMAYGPAADPSFEIAAAAPYSQLRVLALRTAFVVATTLVPAAVGGLLLPGSSLLAVAWLLPGLALTTGTVALSTRTSPQRAAVGLGVAWLVLAFRGLAPRHDPLLVAEPPVLAASAAALLLAAAVLYLRRRDLAELVRRTS